MLLVKERIPLLVKERRMGAMENIKNIDVYFLCDFSGGALYHIFDYYYRIYFIMETSSW